MRDKEFDIIYRRVVPNLHKYFHACLKNARYFGEYEYTKKDLTSLTAYRALLNSRKESLSGYSIEALIWFKAEDVWKDFIKNKKSKTRSLEQIDEESPDGCDALHVVLAREHLERVRAKIDDETWGVIEMLAEGRQYSEISEALNVKEDTLRKRIQRLRNKLEQQSLRFL